MPSKKASQNLVESYNLNIFFLLLVRRNKISQVLKINYKKKPQKTNQNLLRGDKFQRKETFSFKYLKPTIYNILMCCMFYNKHIEKSEKS